MNVTLRVYGLFIVGNQILVSLEEYKGKEMFKFPGGGVQFGEGTREALIREIHEEMGLSIEIGSHIYTTDFFKRSSFDQRQQVLSVYYEIENSSFSVQDIPQFGLENTALKKERFEWRSIESLRAEDFTFDTERAAFKAYMSRKV